MKKNYFKGLFIVMLCVSMLSCKKDYYMDSGINDVKFDGTIMDYLEKDTLYFDTLVRVIKYAGLEETLRGPDVTFFAPPDPCFDKIIRYVNDNQLQSGADSVTRIEQIKPSVWKKYLGMYIFPGNKGLKDFNQIDTLALDTYRGNLFETIDHQVMNIGVIYNDAINDNNTPYDVSDDVAIKYKGYRQLMLSYLYDNGSNIIGATWTNAPVATSDIAPTNGRLHILRYKTHVFSFSPFRFLQSAQEAFIE